MREFGVPMKTWKPWIVAIILSLLIHGGLVAVIAVNSYVRRQTEAARLIVGADSSRVQFFATSGDDGGGGAGGRATDNKEMQTQIEPVSSPLAGISETPSPANDAPTGLLTADLEISPEDHADPAVPSATTDNYTGSGVGIASNSAGSAAGGGGGAGATAAYARNPLPPYPREARERGWQGTALLRVEVLADGTAGKVEIAESSGYLILDETSVQTVRGWKFLPAHSGDTAISSMVEIPITFRLVE
jgi:TonB family protein